MTCSYRFWTCLSNSDSLLSLSKAKFASYNLPTSTAPTGPDHLEGSSVHRYPNDHVAFPVQCVVELEFAVVIVSVTPHLLHVRLSQESDNDMRLVNPSRHLVDNETFHSFFIKPGIETLSFQGRIHLRDRVVVRSPKLVIQPVVRQKSVIFQIRAGIVLPRRPSLV